MINHTDPNEILAVVDADDKELTGQPRHVIHATGLLHRAVHVFIFGPDGRLLLQQRSAKKDMYPLHWECVGGHLAPGESYDAAAAREVEEELGIAANELTFLQKLTACDETGQEFIQVYRAVITETPQPQPDEVIGLHWFTRHDLEREIAASARLFSPSTLHSIRCISLLDDAVWQRTSFH